MSLKVTTDPKEHRQMSMVIEVEDERVGQEMRKAAKKLSRRLKIPGFRKGHAPYHVVVNYVGQGALMEEFVDDLGNTVYREALEQEGIEPFAIASLDEIELEPLRYKLTVPLEPTVTLGDYRSIRVDEDPVEIDEEEVQARIDQMLERHASYVEVDRSSDYGDLMTVDVRAVVLDEEGEESDQVVLDESDWDITPDEENPMEPAGFDEELLGLEAGDEKQFEILWPEESPSMYAGKQVRFQVKVHKIQAHQSPELTDEFAQEQGPEIESAEQLRENIRQGLAEERQGQAEGAYFEKVVDVLVEMSELDYPPAAVETQIDMMMRNTDNELRQMGLQGMEHYLQLVGKSDEEYRNDLREQAELTLRRNLALGQLTKEEELSVSDEELEERLVAAVGSAEDVEEDRREAHQQILEMMRQSPNRELFEDQVLSEKAVERLLAIARGEEIPEPGSEEQEEPGSDSEAALESDEEAEMSAEEVEDSADEEGDEEADEESDEEAHAGDESDGSEEE